MRRRVPRRPQKSAPPRLRSPHRGAVRPKKDTASDALTRRAPATIRERLIDISRPIGESTPVWPGDVPFSWRATAAPDGAAEVGSTCFTMSAHLGSHADAPSHVLPRGISIGAMPLRLFFGRARVVELAGRGEIGADALPRAALGVPRVLFRTGGATFLAPLAALRLAERGAILVGTDALSIDPEDAEDLPAHRTLLSRGIAILENLDLSRATPGDYTLVAAPLAFEDLDASPVRAFLIVPEGS